MRKVGLMVGLALVAIACATGADMVGEMMMDASVPDAGAQDTPAQCEKVGSEPWGDGGRADYYAAEFDADPGQTEVTVCRDGNLFSRSRAYCHRSIAQWHEGTSMGFWSCGVRYFDADGNTAADGVAQIRSVTVHN